MKATITPYDTITSYEQVQNLENKSLPEIAMSPDQIIVSGV